MSQHVHLQEYVRQSGGLTVDVENGVLHGVRILGLTSANGRQYLAEAVKQAIGLYEGVATNCDHPSRPGEATTVARRIGWLENVRQEPDGGLRGNWHLLQSHPMTPVILEVAQKRPQLLGLSHNVSGRVRRENGQEIVEAIEVVNGVDCVADGATVKGLHEGRNQNQAGWAGGIVTMIEKSTVKQIIEATKDKRPAYAKALREMAEAGVMSPDAAMDMPAEAPAGEADHETALKQGFRAAVMAIMDDDSLDTGAKLKKMRDVLRAEEKLIGGNGEEKTPKEEGGDMAAEESRKLKLENTGLRLLLETGVNPSKVLTRALAGCKDEAEMKEIIEEARSGAAGGSQRPRSAGSPVPPAGQDGSRQMQEQRTGSGSGQAPAEPAALGRWLQVQD